jgi:cysteine desulfurase
VTYLDHAATTDLRPEAAAAMMLALDHTGNPSSLHKAGRLSRRSVEMSREQVADAFNARPSEVLFTSGGTESDNQAIKGIHWERQKADAARRVIVSLESEHHAVIDPIDWLVETGQAEVHWADVDSSGIVDLAKLKTFVDQHHRAISLISIMWANNETGVIQPMAEIVGIAKEFKIPVHSDAVQAASCLEIDFGASGLAALSISGHKLGAPTGVGALLLQRIYKPVPVMHGGGQERNIRSGTVAVGLIAALGAAVQASQLDKQTRYSENEKLRDALIGAVKKIIPDVKVTSEQESRMPSIAHFTFRGCEGHTLLMLLDAAGVYCSSGSACTAGVHRPSHVLKAMGYDEIEAMGALRVSFGRTSRSEDIDALLAALPDAVEKARATATVTRNHRQA